MQRLIPQVATVVPVVAFGAAGTTISLPPHAEGTLVVLAYPVVAVASASILHGSRFARAVSGVALITWWFILAISVIAVAFDSHGTTVSWFGAGTFSCIPILVAFTWGLVWGPAELVKEAGIADGSPPK